MLWLQLISFLLVSQSVKVAKMETEKVNYCNFKCGKKHIACNYNQEAGPDCPKDVAAVQLDGSIRNLILSMHIDKRNKVAGGQLKHYHLLPATRMAQMKWNNELAYLAQIKALRCSHSYGECRSTKQFEKPGQSSAWMQYTRINLTKELIPKMIVENRVESWLSSNTICRTEHINKFNNGYNIPNNCDFTLAIIDKNTDIGCAAVHFQVKQRNYFHFVCNYAYSYERGKAPYKTGTSSAISCKTGRDEKYTNLCSAKEEYL